jgi:hypothetical protein
MTLMLISKHISTEIKAIPWDSCPRVKVFHITKNGKVQDSNWYLGGGIFFSKKKNFRRQSINKLSVVT